MTNVSRKCVWAIVLGSLAVATLIFFAWATAGFKNWNAASWFDYWGQGKPAVTKTVEPVEQRAVALQSTNPEHEIITDSGDSIVTFATTALATPSLSVDYSAGVLKVDVGSNVIGTVQVFGYPLLSTSSKSVWFTLTESDFTKTANTATASIPLETVRNKVNALSNAGTNTFNSTMKTNAFTLYAKHVNKNGYVDSGDGSSLLFSDTPEIEAEFTDTTYRVSCLDSFYEKGAYQFCICSTEFEYYKTCLDLKDSSIVTYEDGYLTVDLLGLSDELATKPALDVYYIYFGYSSYRYQTKFSYFDYDNFTHNPIKSLPFVIIRLAAPENLTYNAGTITWNSVAGATDYGVFWTENDIEKKAFVNTTSFTFDINALGEGEHTVRVRALGNLGQTAIAEGRAMSVTAYNASNVISQVVALTYNIDGDVVIKFVPYGSKLSDYIYDVNIKGREFGGWYYDSGYSRKVDKTDVLSGDTVIYARLSDKKVTERPLTWWEQHKWQILIPCFVVVGLLIIAGMVVAIRKKKAA